MTQDLIEEANIVNSIYENCAQKVSESVLDVSFPGTQVVARLLFPNEYPTKAPRVLSVSKCPNAEGLVKCLEKIVQHNFTQDEPFIYTFIDEALPEVEKWLQGAESASAAVEEPSKGSLHIDKWAVSKEIVDRKSIFVGRCIGVSSQKEALEMIADLLLDKKIARATHSMTALRISANGAHIQDCNDDGESAAGSRLLHLLNIAKCENVVVVVTRWFGGVHLGPDRFKHINNAAREALVEGGFIVRQS